VSPDGNAREGDHIGMATEVVEAAEVVETTGVAAFGTAPLVLDRVEGTPSPATHIAWSFLHQTSLKKMNTTDAA
jgi:hypothetical protein